MELGSKLYYRSDSIACRRDSLFAVTPCRRGLAAGLATLGLLAAGCSARSSGTASSSRGTANLAAAGSLEGVIQTRLQPAFESTTKDSVVTKFAGSGALTEMVKDGEIDPGVFLSIGAGPIEALFPHRCRYVMTLATDPLVLAYSPRSRYAPQLNAIKDGQKPFKDLFTLLEQQGFRLRRTDPVVDAQGGYFILMLRLAERVYRLPTGTAARILGATGSNPIGSSTQIVDENALATEIASGTFDAGSDFLTEARQCHLDYIRLPPSIDFADPAELSRYASVTLRLSGGEPLRGGLITLDDTFVLAPRDQPRSRANRAADEAFLAFLLSKAGRRTLAGAGYSLEKPRISYAAGYSRPSSVLAPSVLRQYRRLQG